MEILQMPEDEAKLFTDKYIVNGHGFHDKVMSMDELDTILFSGSEFSVKKEEKLEVIDVDGE